MHIPQNTYSRRLFLARSGRMIGGAALVGSIPILASCGDDDDDEGAASSTSPPAGTSAPAPTSDAPGTTAAGGATGTVGTQFSWVPDIEWAAWYLAEANGNFANRGVTSVLGHGGPNTPAVVQVLAAGDGQIGLSGDELEILNANATGADYIALAAMYQRSPFGYCWLAETPISGPADLVGRRIGGVQGDQIRIDAIFEINGLPVDYEFVPMSFDPQPLVDGEMDIITCYVTNQPVQFALQGVEVNSAPFSDFGLPSYGDVIFASRAWVAENRDLVVQYLAALLEGVDANRADPTAAVPILVEQYGADNEIDEAYATAGNPAYIALMDSDFTAANGLLSMDPAFLESDVWPGLEAAGQTDLPAVADFLDTSLLADAHAAKA
jgi:ABC-type nitrate/sulfonate/bicarbonate transport system substrate-binding protein